MVSESLDVKAADFQDRLKDVCKRLMTQGGDAAWGRAAAADVEVKQISGGITNVLYRLGLKEASAAPAVLARVFGKAGDAVCDRKRENEIFAELSDCGFGPKLHGVFGNGRLEGWLEGRRPLEALEMLRCQFAPLIAQRLAQMHQEINPKSDQEVWAQLREWIALGKEVSFPHDATKAEKLKRLAPYPRFEDEVNWVESMLPSPANGHGASILANEAWTPVQRRARELLFERRFCHLDLLSGNIMYSEAEKDVSFIDFEYAMHSYVGLDIANHFNATPESCLILNDSFEPDKYYPSLELQKRFLCAYFEARGVSLGEELLEEMLRVVLDFTLQAELRWVVWSVVQAGYSPVDFDYLAYGVMRFEDGYQQYKAWRQAGARPHVVHRDE